jgi:hypothetical protein
MDSMSDNIINFPKESHFTIELLEDAQLIEGVGEMIDIFTQGLNSAHNVDSEIIMAALMQGAAIWGIRSGMSPDDVMDMFKRMKVRLEEEYDA